MITHFKSLVNQAMRRTPGSPSFFKKKPPRFKAVWPQIDEVEGFLVKGQEKWLFDTARSLPRGASILEIGGFKGRSTTCLAYGCVNTDKQVFTIDKFKGVYADVADREDLKKVFDVDFFHHWQDNLKRNGLQDYAIPYIGDSRVIGREWTTPIHMLFIDGSHLFEDVMDDFSIFYPHVVPNGIVALHDVTPNWPGPYEAWHQHVKNELINVGKVTTLAYGQKPRAG